MKRFRSVKAPKKHDVSEFDGNGIRYPAKFVGRVPVEGRSGSDACQQAMRLAKSQLKSGLYNPAKKRVKTLIKISVDGLSTAELKTGKLITKNPVHRITSWYPDESSSDTFGIIVKGEGGISGEADAYCCIVLKSPKAKATVNALKQLVEIVFEPEFEEVSETIQPPEESLEKISAANLDDEDTWICRECTFPNKGQDLTCSMCQAPRIDASVEDDVEMVDPYGTVPNGDCDEDEDEAIPSFEATHDEEVTPDYMNIFEGVGLAAIPASPAISVFEDDDGPDYMNLPDAEPVEEFRERTSSAPETLKRTLSGSNPFHRQRSVSARSATNPFQFGAADDSSDEDDASVGNIDFNALFSK